GHQHVAMDGAAVFGRCVHQPIAVARVIGFGKEDGLTIVPALDDMQWLIGKKVARTPRHRSSSCCGVQTVAASPRESQPRRRTKNPAPSWKFPNWGQSPFLDSRPDENRL